jgi:hypothetical protein
MLVSIEGVTGCDSDVANNQGGKTDMNRTLFHFIFLILAAALLASPVQAKNSYLNSVNSTCMTSYGCDL